MSTFKIKHDKKYIHDTRITLDAKHKMIINKFKTNKKNISLIETNIDNTQEELYKLNLIENKQLTDDELCRKQILKFKLIKLTKNKKGIQSNDDMNNYFIKTAPILYKYYDNILKFGKNIKNKDHDNVPSNTKKNSVINFFSIGKKETVKNNIIEKKKLSDYTNNKKKFKRSCLLNDYLSIVDINYVKKTKQELDSFGKCTKCGIEKIIMQSEGFIVCTQCGEKNRIMIDSDKPSFKDPPPEISYFAYKRINHFNEILAQFQGKESTEIPEDVFDKIIIEITKERITNMALLNNKKVKDYLKRLRLNKYYEHVPHIINRLSGLPPPVLSPVVEDKLRIMFKEIQSPFRKVCPPDRKNFLSYYYVLHKFVELLGLDEFKSCFPLLKSREKLHDQDKIWKDICKILQWEFVRSV
tara:strand:- start:2797 stop:4032 length:1236 start_codon:yes stop_codon:yes gene_type:complete